jgi:endoglucanase
MESSTKGLLVAIVCLGMLEASCLTPPPEAPHAAVKRTASKTVDPKRAPLVLKPGPADPKKGEDAPAWRYIAIDQFGYRPDMKKVAVLVDPEDGFNAADDYKPGETFELRKWADGAVVWSGRPAPWNKGAVQKNAGDRGWWLDFSEVREPGAYFVFDKDNRVRSYEFQIGNGVYRRVLEAAVRMYYYNRANFEKKRPFACVGDKCWEQGRDYMGPGQDGEARSVRARGDEKTARDLSGGWWDAGDTNKYVTFAIGAVHPLLTAYRHNPKAFTDDYNVPESGNGIPDLLDQIKVETDWLMKMQPKDLGGGVLIKMGEAGGANGRPEEDKVARFYYPEPCSSATLAASGMFAHASLVFAGVPAWKDYAGELKQRALDAWKWYGTHERNPKCDDGTIKSGNADWSLDDQDQNTVEAAVYLYALTGDKAFEEAMKKNLHKTHAFKEDRWSVYGEVTGEALLYYTTLPNADASLKEKITSRKKDQAKSVDIYKLKPEQDLYLAFMRDESYHWGSNSPRANYGNNVYELIQYGLAADADKRTYLERAEGMLHSFHGVNPMQIVYLSNMYPYGATDSVNEIFHTWFFDGTKWDNAKTSEFGPAPGYVAGGPNHSYCEGAKDHLCHDSLVARQPSQKAFLDFNTSWDPKKEFDQSWEITEPGIYYQAAYVLLLSKFVD